jgi:hypothetical protein
MSEQVINEIEQALDDLLRPTRELDAKLEAREQQLVVELVELREQRRKLKGILRVADPEYGGSKPGPKKNTTAEVRKYISDERLTVIETFLRENADKINANGGMNQGAIFALAAWPSTWKTSVGYAIRLLHERGFLRLDHTSPMRGGPVKFWKVNA